MTRENQKTDGVRDQIAPNIGYAPCLQSITMAIELVPLPLPASADNSRFTDFGRQVIGLHPGKLTPEELTEIQEALYKVGACRHLDLARSWIQLKYGALLFRKVVVTPEEQYAFTKVNNTFDSHFRSITENDSSSSIHILNLMDMATIKLNLPRNPSFIQTSRLSLVFLRFS